MRPFILKIPIPFTDLVLPIHSYGFMLAMGFLFAIFLLLRQAKQQGESEDHVYGMAYWVVISSILGSRIFHCIVYWENYVSQPWRIFYVWEGGLVFYGGLIAAIIASEIYFLKNKLSFWKWADMGAPGIALGLAFGRGGCLLVGCCHGKQCPADFPMALTFPNTHVVELPGIPLYPTQIWSIIANLSIAAVLYFLFRPRKKYHGQVMAWFLILYSIFRTTVEFWRADPRGFLTLFHISGPAGATADTTTGIFSKLLFFETLSEVGIHTGKFAFQISESQLVSIFMILFAIGISVYQRKHAKVNLTKEVQTKKVVDKKEKKSGKSTKVGIKEKMRKK